MALKKNNPGCNVASCCAPARPCCADVWDAVRLNYSGMKGSLVNVSSAISSTTTFYEYYEFTAGVRSYQCSTGVDLAEQAPPAADSYSIATGITRVKWPHALNPATGLWSYLQSAGSGKLLVSNCDPETIKVEGQCGYRLQFLEGYVPDWSARGYTCVTSDGYTCSKWQKVVGNTTSTAQRITDLIWDLSAAYLAEFTTLPSGIPFPLTVAHEYNPANISTLLEWVP